MKKAFAKIWNAVSTLFVVLIVLCAILLMGARLIGYQCYTVISGSMRPEFNVGDLIYVKSVDVNTIEVGDPVTFILNEDLVVATHRVVRVDAENQRLYTKGDANEVEDSEPVHFNNVIGVPQFSVPKLGYVSEFIQNPPGMYISLVVGAILIISAFVPDVIEKKKKKEEPEDDDSAVSAVQLQLDSATEENERLKAELEKLRSESADQKSE